MEPKKIIIGFIIHKGRGVKNIFCKIMPKEKNNNQQKKEEGTKEEKDKEEKGQKEVAIPQNLKKIVEEIENLSVLDLAELVKVLEKKFGVSATPQVITVPGTGAVPGQAGQTTPEGQEEKSSFNIVLTAVGDKKIEVIKVMRDVTGKGLKESKDIVDAVESAPQVIKEGVKKEEAEEIKNKFEEAGAKVELK